MDEFKYNSANLQPNVTSYARSVDEYIEVNKKLEVMLVLCELEVARYENLALACIFF